MMALILNTESIHVAFLNLKFNSIEFVINLPMFYGSSLLQSLERKSLQSKLIL